MSKYMATIRMTVTVDFTDNGTDDLKCQAVEAFDEQFSSTPAWRDADIEIVGEPEISQ